MHSPYLILSQYLNPRSYSKLLKNAPPLTLITFLIRCIKIKMHPQKYFNHMLMIINWTIWWYHDIPDLIVPYFHSRFKVSWLMNMITHSIIMQSGNAKNGFVKHCWIKWYLALPDFCRSVKESQPDGQIMPTTLLSVPRIFRPSFIPKKLSCQISSSG